MSDYGQSLARIVSTLTRNINREVYKKRIENSDYKVQIVKLAETEQKQTTHFSMQSVSNETGFSSVSPNPKQTHDFSHGYKSKGFGDFIDNYFDLNPYLSHETIK